VRGFDYNYFYPENQPKHDLCPVELHIAIGIFKRGIDELMFSGFTSLSVSFDGKNGL